MNVSIITPSYNQSQFLKQTILSVISQPNCNCDYQIIDGGSTDSSSDLIKSFESNLSYWVSEPDRGQSHAINKGLHRVKGDIVNWLNSDDYYEPGILQVVSQNFTNSMTGLGGRSRLFNTQGTLSFSRGTDIFPGNLAKTLGWARIDQPETFFSKLAWDRVGLLNENLHYCMDREWWMRYLYHFGLEGYKKIDDVLVNFRIHDDSKTVTSQVGFLREHHSLFYALAKVVQEEDAMQWMQENLDIDTELQTDINSWRPGEALTSAFHYYLLKSADEFYARNKMKLATGLLSLVDIRKIAKFDIRLYRRLKFRIPFGPVLKYFKK